MPLYRNFITLGAIACLCLMLKLIKNKLEAAGEKSPPTESDEIDQPKSGETDQPKSGETDQPKSDETDQPKSCEIKEQESEKTVDSTQKKNKQKEEKSEKAMKFLRPKPNFFIAVQVTNTGIHEKVKALQEKVISKNPLLKPALIDPATLHITLSVTHLANTTDVETVKDKLDEWAAQNMKRYFEHPCVLSFKGVKTFRNEVAYVDLESNPSVKKLTDLSEDMNNLLSSTGFFTDQKKLTPHLTFLKLSKQLSLVRMKKKFHEDFELLKKCNDFFGKQEVSQLQLLSMDSPKDELGYYKCFHKISVPDSDKSETN